MLLRDCEYGDENAVRNDRKHNRKAGNPMRMHQPSLYPTPYTVLIWRNPSRKRILIVVVWTRVRTSLRRIVVLR